MEISTPSHQPKTIEARYDATIIKMLPLKNPESGDYEKILLQLQSNTSHKVAFLLNTNEIRFSSPGDSGQFWVQRWGIIYIDNHPILLVQEQKNYVSLGFYRLDGTIAPLRLQSQLGTEETIARVQLDSVEWTKQNNGMMNVKLISIFPMDPAWNA